jgi:isoleucyl-tRNA synthetase
MGEQVLKTIHASLVKYRTTMKMLLGSMHEKAHELPLTTLDKIALCQLDKTMGGVWEAWQTYDFHKAVGHINRWASSDLSAFYLEGAKDRLYCGDGGSVLYHVFHGFLQMLAPITPLLVEEAWEHRPEWFKNDQYVLSVHNIPIYLEYQSLTGNVLQICSVPLPPNPRPKIAPRNKPISLY